MLTHTDAQLKREPSKQISQQGSAFNTATHGLHVRTPAAYDPFDITATMPFETTYSLYDNGTLS